MLATFGKVIAGIGLAVAALFGYHETQTQQVAYGSFSPTGGGTYRTQASISTTDTSIVLSSFKEPVSNIPYTMTYLNSSIGYGTIEPGNSAKREFISFTGVTQNSDGTATLTGVLRGLSSTPGTQSGGQAVGCVASSTLASTHSGQSIFILSNSPCFYYNNYLPTNTNATSSGILVFGSTTQPRYDGAPTLSGYDLVDYTTLLNTAIQGAATSTFGIMGISQLATQTQVQNATASSTEGRPLVLSAKFSTSTCAISGVGNVLISSTTTGKLNPPCFDQTYPYSFTATTTIAASSSTAPLKLNGINYGFPSTQGASSTELSTDGNGTLTWEPVKTYFFAYTTTTYTNNTTSTTTPYTLIIPANTLSTSRQFILDTNWSDYNYNGGHCTFDVEYGNGSATTTLFIIPNATGTNSARAMVMASSTSSALGTSYVVSPSMSGSSVYLPYSLSTQTYFAFKLAQVSAGTDVCTLDKAMLEIISA